MTQQVHDTFIDLIPAYAIGAADAEERALLDAHLQVCADCRTLLQDYRAMSEDLLFAAPLASAPAGLSERLRKRLGPPQTTPVVRSWRDCLRVPQPLRNPWLALGIAALALLVFTNVYWAGRVGRLERRADAFAALAQAPGITLRVSNGVDTAYDGRSADGVVYVQPGSPVALLCVYALPQLDGGKTYQAWLVRDGQRISAGTFNVNHDGYGVLLIDAGQPVTNYQQLGITVEPAGGSPAPTTPRVMGGEL